MSKVNFDKDYNELIKLLDQVPGVVEHMNSLEVKMGKEILQRRINLGLTQSQLVEAIKKTGETITQSTISKVETGDTSVGAATYNKILSALGGIKEVHIEFGDYPSVALKELSHV